MRRYTFYLSVALLAFGFGSFIVFKFYWNSENTSVENQVYNVLKIEQTEKSINESVKKEIEIKNILLKDLPCKDKILQLVWNELTDEEAYVTQNEAESIKECSDILEVHEITDLNKDGVKEIIIASCKSPFVGSGGCSFWVFQKTNKNKYRKLFEAFGSFNLENTWTRGYRDILSGFRYSSDEYGYTVYKYNGQKYVPQKCWMEHLTAQDKDVKIKLLKKPKITFYKCKETD